MRVIAGSAKGVRLGAVPPGVRPVSDRVREGVFSSLGALVEGARVVDLFAGTGAMGIEALSRGAEHALFVDRSRRSLDAVRDNLARTRLEDRASVILGDATDFVMRDVHSEEATFDLVLADPPYDHPVEQVERLLEVLASGHPRPRGVLLTRAMRRSELVLPVHWGTSRRLEYGDTAVLFLREA